MKEKDKTMKHIKTFESFLNEAARFNPKPFDQVKPGNTAFVYGDNSAWEVIATGYGDNFDSTLKKYDASGAAADMHKNPASYGMDKEEWEETELIAIKHGSEVAVYVYGEDGAWVNK